MSKTAENMIGKWRDALAQYGLTEKQLSGKHTSCPNCGGVDRFRFINEDGTGSYYCSHCKPGNGFSLLMK